MTDDFIRYGTLGGVLAISPDRIASLFKEGNLRGKIDEPLVLEYFNGRKEKWSKTLDYLTHYIVLFRQWAYRQAYGNVVLLQEIDNYIKDLYEWLKQGREKGQLDDIESRRLQLLKESLTEKLYEYVPERLILGGQESIDRLLRDIENSEHITNYPPRPSNSWYNAEIERLCLLSEKIKLLRKLVEKIHPEDANKYHYLYYLFEILGHISGYIGVLERSRDELYASIGKVKIDIAQHFSKLDESIANTSRDIKRHFSELEENLVASKPLEIKEIIRALKQYRSSKDISTLPPIRQLYNTLHEDKKQYAEKAMYAIAQLGRAVRSEAGYHQYNLLEELSDNEVLSDIESRNTNGNQQISNPANAKQNDLTDTESNIVEALNKNEMTGEKLAAKAGYPYNSNFKSTLSSLRKRGILGNKAPGYFLEPKYHFLISKSGRSQDKRQD
ncbi:MAG: hypothetical protein PHY02_02150 [Phycisphaerae bacterium]|nr:hypothetical protein [Phycisphaerae bacterium]